MDQRPGKKMKGIITQINHPFVHRELMLFIIPSPSSKTSESPCFLRIYASEVLLWVNYRAFYCRDPAP